MRFTALACALALCISAPLTAQAPSVEYGSESELAGVTRIFVYTGDDLESRNNMIKGILQDLPNLTVTERASDAEVVLVFGRDVSEVMTSVVQSSSAQGNATTSGNMTNGSATASSVTVPVYTDRETGNGRVMKIGDGRVRYLMAFNSSRTSWIAKRPSSRFAIEFVKAYCRANGLPEPVGYVPAAGPKPF
jgi:hypothetical protein